MLLLWCSQDHDGSTHNQLQTGCLASCRTLISNRRWGMQVIAEGYPRGKKELLGALSRFGPTETADWFRREGVTLKTEADGRMFPITDSSQTVIDALGTAS
jgi:predicted flavoprotein YhiN